MRPEVTTYRYVRFTLLMLLLALAVSVTAQTLQGGWETSISSYYYTPAGPVFIAVLTALGVCLIALRGQTDAEEVCLQLAGISAPMVAFVPTPEIGEHVDQRAVVNSAGTFLTVLAVGYVVVVLFGLRERHRGVLPDWPSRWGLIGLVSTALAWIVGVVWLITDRHSFARHAHLLAAAFTFAPFAGVVVLNTSWGMRVLAGRREAPRQRFEPAYAAIVVGIVVVTVGGLLSRSWDYWLLATEIGLLALFALFWTLQSLAQLAERSQNGAERSRSPVEKSPE